MLSEYLKLNTKAHHDSVESSIDLVACSSDLEAYTKLIKSFYGYYFHLEKTFGALKKEFLDLGIDLEVRKKTNLLLDDLQHLNLSEKEIQSLPLCDQYPEIKNISQAMSALYVLEGSTLGGQIIFKQLSKSGILVDGEARGRFFKSYGPATRSMWTDFKTSLDSLPENQSEVSLKTAQDTFKSLEVWLTAHNS